MITKIKNLNIASFKETGVQDTSVTVFHVSSLDSPLLAGTFTSPPRKLIVKVYGLRIPTSSRDGHE